MKSFDWQTWLNMLVLVAIGVSYVHDVNKAKTTNVGKVKLGMIRIFHSLSFLVVLVYEFVR